MKIELYIFVILILFGCKSNKVEIDTSEYSFRDCKSNRILYEYKNSNIHLYPVSNMGDEKV